ncbi:lipocalin-like domain-containing protein [Paenibacillus sp. HJGM_3]|uniref:lipocalin-like domain-containing protein n=1 Tax=Paenibacillus sp. HJGM_3 TaxID=3379816 RepID=UPI00385EAD3E
MSRGTGLIGTWRLVSYENKMKSGEKIYPLGEDAIGYLMYAADGHMSVALMGVHRRPFESGVLDGGTTEEKSMAMGTYISYAGMYEVHEDCVLHHIEVSLFPNWIGVTQKRFYEEDEDRLTLISPPIVVQEQTVTYRLVWKKVK